MHKLIIFKKLMDVANGIKLQLEFNKCNFKLQLINLLIKLFATNVHLWMELFSRY
jgi:hypothetical protein